jgi:hypothetical protein
VRMGAGQVLNRIGHIWCIGGKKKLSRFFVNL